MKNPTPTLINSQEQLQKPSKLIKIKQLVQTQSPSWLKKSQDKTQQQFLTVKHEFMLECYQILLRSLMRQEKAEKLEYFSMKLPKFVEIIENTLIKLIGEVYYDWRVRVGPYGELWARVMEELWKEYLWGEGKIVNYVRNQQEKKLKEYLKEAFKIELSNNEDSPESPIFSQDSYKEQEKTPEPKNNKKIYGRTNLKMLLHESALLKMKGRLEEVPVKMGRNYLLSDFKLVFYPNSQK